MKMSQQTSWILAVFLAMRCLSIAAMTNDESFVMNQLPDDPSGIVTINTGDPSEEISDEEILLDPLLSALHGNFYSKRSDLNKNFIRFGRAGMQQKVMKRFMEGEADPEEREMKGIRPSRGLKSNFIRFGRSFFPSQTDDEMDSSHPRNYRRLARKLPSNFIRFG